MKTVLKILAILFALGFIGQLLAGNLFLIAAILSGVCAFFGWKKPNQKRHSTK